jgi:NhaP-type Na+/H+ or K+/H+ antiporter
LRPKPDREGTVEVEHILHDFGLILGAGLFSQLAATLLRVPEMIMLVAVGALIGASVLGIVSNPLGRDELLVGGATQKYPVILDGLPI